MARFHVHKTNFTAGEVSPLLLGRGDLRAYHNGAKRLRNVFIHPTGGVSRRPGLRFVDQTMSAGRLIAFEFNSQQTYLLAFLDGMVSIYKDNFKIAQLPSPWTAAHVPQLNWTQSADTLLVVHPDIPPKKITRSAGSTWDLSDWTFFGTDARISCPHYKFARHEVTLSPSALSGAITVNASDAIFDPKHVGTRFRLDHREILINGVTSPKQASAEVKEPLTSLQPSNNWTEQAFSSVRGWPTSVCFHQDRLVIGGSQDLPNHLWLSKSGDLFNFELGEGLDDEAISFPILSDQVNAIRYVFSGRHLQVFTSGAEWMVSGDPLTPTTIQLHRQTRIGSPTDRTVPPQDVDGATLFIPRNGPQLREFLFTDTEQAYQAADLAMLAHHLIHRPIDMDYDPASRLFHIVMEDGSMATLTLYRDEQVTAWTRQETDGEFLSVATLGERTYVLVERENGWCIETFDSELNMDSALSGQSPTPTQHWTGLYHLETKRVKVVADGVVVDDATVQAGSVELSEPATRSEVGLGFTHIIEPLAPPFNSGPSSMGGKMRPVSFTFRVQNAGALFVDTGRGARQTPLRRFGQSKFDQCPLPINGDVRVKAMGWRSPGPEPLWRIEQDTPLPFTLLAVSSEVSANG